jgi:Flp pilus assembly protein TadG
MLEMVIVLPLLLLLLFALAEFGIMLGQFLMVNNAAREGARTAIVFRQNCDATTVEAEVVAAVQAYASMLGLTIPATDISSSGLCAGSGSDASVTVNFSYDFDVLPGIAPSIGTMVNLTGASVMRNEG